MSFLSKTNTPYLIDKTIQSFKHDCTCLYIKRYVVYTSVYLNFEKQILLSRVSVFSITFNPFLYNIDVRSRNKNTSYLYKSKMRRGKKIKHCRNIFMFVCMPIKQGYFGLQENEFLAKVHSYKHYSKCNIDNWIRLYNK